MISAVNMFLPCVANLKYTQARRNVGRAGGAEKKLRARKPMKNKKIVTNYKART